MEFIVTGGAGFLGTHICRELDEHGHETVVLDHHLSPSQDLRYQRNVEYFFDRHADADCCIHLAAEVGRLLCEDDPMATVMGNVGMTALVARACGKRGIRLAYASTSEAYGDNGTAICDELEGPFSRSHNLYGITKFQGEDICRHYAPDGLTIFRFSMPYGPGQPAGYGRAAIVNMLYQALHRQPITVHRGGERSWCYVSDAVRAVRLTLREPSGIWNIGRDDAAVSMLSVAAIACELTGASRSLIQVVDPPRMQSVIKRLSMRRLYELGWSPKVDLTEGMSKTLEWVKTLPGPLEAAA